MRPGLLSSDGRKGDSSRDLEQLLASGETLWQPIKQVEPTDDEGSAEGEDRAAEDSEQDVKQASCFRQLRQPFVAQGNENAGNSDQGYETDHPIEQNREKRSGFFSPGFLSEKIAF